MEIGIVRQVGIVDEIRDAYLDYAMSVITSRALPDVRDGLKPVQRRILYGMDDLGLRHDKPHKKSARIVGDVLGKYHPHSDVAVYDAMVRMAQDFTMRYTLIDGHGNFGSVDGDGAAAMRYTEARLAAIAEEMLADLDKDTVDFVDNFDATLKEPRVLPARLPNLLLNGASGIAVGMATNVPPHNLTEVCDAISYLIDRYDKVDDIAVEDLMHFVKGPDFPTGGTILGTEGITSAYATGKGRVVVRARAHIEDLKGGRTAIIVTELPYQVNKSSLVEKIADLVRNRKIETISDLRDESDRTGMRIVIEIKRGADTESTLNQLLKYTQMQTTFGVNMLALVDGEPRVLSLKRVLHLFVEHRREVITRRSKFELARAKARAHILEGLKIALDNLDEVINIIRRSKDAETAQATLMKRFKLDEIQARAILDLQLRRLAALERHKIEEELAEMRRLILYLEKLLKSPKMILALVKDEMAELKTKYGDARRTRIGAEESAEFAAEDLIPSEEAHAVLTQHGYVRRLSAAGYRALHRQAEGTIDTPEDAVLQLLIGNTADSVLFFSDRGRVFQQPLHQVPEETRQPRGIPVGNLIGVGPGENIIAATVVAGYDAAEFLAFVTAQGKIKRVALSEFNGTRAAGGPAIGLDEGDTLRWVGRTPGGQELILLTAQGKAIRFGEDEVRPMGRAAGGVNAIRLAEGDEVATAAIVGEHKDLLFVTRQGMAKRAPVADYTAQSRGGAGLQTLDSARLKSTGPIVAAATCAADDLFSLITAQGQTVALSAGKVARTGRSGRMSTVVQLKQGDAIAALLRLGTAEPAGAGSPRPPVAHPGGNGQPDGPAEDEAPKKTRSVAAKALGKGQARAEATPAKSARVTKESTAPAAKKAGKAEAKPAKGKAAPAAKTKSTPAAKEAAKAETKPVTGKATGAATPATKAGAKPNKGKPGVGAGSPRPAKPEANAGKAKPASGTAARNGNADNDKAKPAPKSKAGESQPAAQPATGAKRKPKP